MNILDKVQYLTPLANELKNCTNSCDKVDFLYNLPNVQKFLKSHLQVRPLIEKFSMDQRVGLISLIALGEGNIVFNKVHGGSYYELITLASNLHLTELFYNTIGGVVGYHLAYLQLLQGIKPEKKEQITFENPVSFHSEKASLRGIKNLDHIAFFFPVGGAGDRLDLRDEKTGEPLPAAKLVFTGRTLLEGLIRDLQGMEYLYHKLYGKQITIPTIFMTSHEKKNNERITSIFEKNQWFHRDRCSLKFLVQPLVPVITKDGRWSFSGPTKLNVKPGGHGVIWKLALDEGVFKKMARNRKTKAILRQVNNPVAGLGDNLIRLIGSGFKNNKTFGTITCDRPVNISEGMVVLKRITSKNSISYCLTNIEYTEFLKTGLKDEPRKNGSPYSLFPSNTNILFVDLKAVEKSIKKHPLPGMTINLKSKFETLTESGKIEMIQAARVETIAQAVASDFVYETKKELNEHDKPGLPSFSIYKPRYQASSTTKRLYQKGSSSEQTPRQAFYDLQKNHFDLFSCHSNMQLPEPGPLDQYLKDGPSFIIDYHPALGPLYDIISQKVSGGALSFGSEMILEIAELQLENIFLDGSLRVLSDSPLGKMSSNRHLRYGNSGGKCQLIDVKVVNNGINRQAVKEWWKGDYQRHNSLDILIHGNGEFYANGVTFRGAYQIEVESGTRVTAHEKEGQISFIKEKISKPTWSWIYTHNKSQINLLATKVTCI